MPKEATSNGDAPGQVEGAWSRVSKMQAKLHCWAAADPGRRFDDLFNFVHDPATLIVAFDRVAGNTGSQTPGVDGLTVADVQEQIGVRDFLDDLRTQLKEGTFRPLPVRERKIPKPGGSGKVRSLGIPAVADRVAQAALKLVLEPIFEADFEPVSYGFRPKRRAQDAIAEIHYFGTRGYRWVLDADIEACFDRIDHVALMDRVRLRVKDKRVLALVKAFLKAGVLTELGENTDTLTGTPQGGILSPLLANIALSVLDEHLHGPWKPGGTMSTEGRRQYRRRKGSPTWRIIRYADDFVVLVFGTEDDVTALREEIAGVLAPLGLRLSEAKTQVVHMTAGFDFLGFRIQWRRKKGTDKWHVYTFISQRAVRSVKAKIRALTHRTSQQDLKYVLTRLNQIMHGWANYFKHAVAKDTFSMLDSFAWWRIVRMMRQRHRWKWADVRRWLVGPTGRWRPITADGTELRQIAAIPVTRYRYRSSSGASWLMTKRRSRGDGGLHWDDKRERWIASVTVGYKPDGKRIVRTASDKQKSKALVKLKEKLRDLEDGIPSEDAKYTVAQAVENWLQYGLNGRDKNTRDKLAILANKHVIPALGARKLRELSADDVDRWLAQKASEISTRTLEDLRSILKRSVTRAQARDKVKRNVVLLCELPKGWKAGRPNP